MWILEKVEKCAELVLFIIKIIIFKKVVANFNRPTYF